MFLQWCRDELVESFIFVQRLVSSRDAGQAVGPPSRSASDGQAGGGFEKAPLQKHNVVANAH